MLSVQFLALSKPSIVSKVNARGRLTQGGVSEVGSHWLHSELQVSLRL